RLVASANGFATQEGTASDSDGVPVILSAGVAIRDIRFNMTPLAEIGGRILKEGSPITGATVVLMRPNFTSDGDRHLEEEARTKTGENGGYAFANVVPRRYYLATYSAPDSDAVLNGFEPFHWTYYPGVIEAEEAVEVVVRPGTNLWDIPV